MQCWERFSQVQTLCGLDLELITHLLLFEYYPQKRGGGATIVKNIFFLSL